MHACTRWIKIVKNTWSVPKVVFQSPFHLSPWYSVTFLHCHPPAQFVTSAWTLWRTPIVPGSQNWTSSCQGPGNQGAQQQNNLITGCQKGSSRLTAHVFICSRGYVGKFTAATPCLAKNAETVLGAHDSGGHSFHPFSMAKTPFPTPQF